MRHGVVLFNDAILKKAKDRNKAPTEGWASIDGGSSFRINGITELESDVKWWTNLEFGDFYSNQIGRHPNFFPSGFLRTELKAISEEIGANIDHMSADKSAQALATVYSRVMRLAEGALGVKTDVAVGVAKALPDMIAARVINKYKIPDEINVAMHHAYQVQTQCLQKYQRDWKSVTLRKPRYHHAIDVLSTPVPSEYRWNYIGNAAMPVSGDKRIDWCVSHELPVLANVVVKPNRSDLASILSYGSGANRDRAWVCQAELLWISQFCEVEVIGAFVCEAGFEVQKEIEGFPTLGDFSYASYSLGLLAESFWVSMASPRTSAFGQKFFPPRAVWYRAMDRLSLFMSAARLHKESFRVVGYGAGSIWLSYPAGATQDLIDAADAMGLDVPVSKYRELRIENRLIEDE